MGLEFYLVSTSHLEDRLWFRSDADFKEGMNAVAVIAHLTGIQVLAFILMSNHVHFVLQCRCSEARRFITQFKQHYSAYLRRKYGLKEALRGNEVDIRPVNLGDESLERAIAYVLMNCVAANICPHPSLYPWGTGSVIFNMNSSEGKPVGTYSIRSLQKTLHTHCRFPDSFLVSENGYILPESYVAVSFLESLFRTPQRLNWFLFNSSKAKLQLSRMESSLPSFRDQSILSAIPDLCMSLFRKKPPASCHQSNWQSFFASCGVVFPLIPPNWPVWSDSLMRKSFHHWTRSDSRVDSWSDSRMASFLRRRCPKTRDSCSKLGRNRSRCPIKKDSCDERSNDRVLERNVWEM